MDKKLIMLKNLFQVIINNLDILLVLISLVTKVYLMPHLIGLYLTPKVFVLNIGLLLLLTSGAYILKFRRTFLLLVNTACSLMFLADILNYRYFSIPLTSYAFLQTPNLSGLSSSIFALFRWSDLILFADFLFLPLLFFPIKRNPKQGKVFLISQLILGLALTCAYPVSQLYAEQSELFRRFDTGKEFRKFGPLGFHVVDTAYYIKDQNIKLDTEKEDMILDWFTRREQRMLKESASKLESIAKGMNLIVIQVESLQNFVIGNLWEVRQLHQLKQAVKEQPLFSSFLSSDRGREQFRRGTGSKYLSLPNKRRKHLFSFPGQSVQFPATFIEKQRIQHTGHSC